MAFVIKYYIVRFQITIDNVSLVKILKRQQHLAEILSCPVFPETALALQDAAKIAARAEVEDEE